jgi:hypothetical protein
MYTHDKYEPMKNPNAVKQQKLFRISRIAKGRFTLGEHVVSINSNNQVLGLDEVYISHCA